MIHYKKGRKSEPVEEAIEHLEDEWARQARARRMVTATERLAGAIAKAAVFTWIIGMIGIWCVGLVTTFSWIVS